MAEIGRRKLDLDRVEEVIATLSPRQAALFCELSPNQISLMRELLAVRASHPGVHILKKTSMTAPPKRGTLIQAIQRVIERHDVITSTAALSDLNNEGFEFANENPIAGVSAVLTKLCKRGVLIMTRKGTGAIPTQFRKAGHHSQKAKATA